MASGVSVSERLSIGTISCGVAGSVSERVSFGTISCGVSISVSERVSFGTISCGVMCAPFIGRLNTYLTCSTKLRSKPLGRAHAAALNRWLAQWPAVVP